MTLPGDPATGGDPAPGGAPAAPDSVFDEIRRQRDEGAGARGLLLRALGLVVLGLAVWVIARNVSWDDTLRITRAEGQVVLVGEIAGDWRAEEVRFHLASRGGVEEALAADGALPEAWRAAVVDSVRARAELVATRDEVRLPGGRAVASVPREEGLSLGEGVLTAERIDWRPGMVRTLREIDVAGLLPALAFLVLASLCVVTRWWRLLALNDCATTWWNAFRYTYSGLFFNTVVPGFNGGDVARAVAVVREHPDRRSDAFMTVVVDRVLGLVAMVLVGTALVLGSDARLDPLKLPVALFCGAVLVGAGLFFNQSVRRITRFEQLVGALPQGERLLRLDAGARRLLTHPGEVLAALAFSFGNHLFNGLAVFTAARALGTALGFPDWMATMAIANTLAAVPLSPGGLGVGEVLFGSLAELLGSTYAIGVATCLLYRLCLYAMSLLGGLVMLLPGSRPRTP